MKFSHSQLWKKARAHGSAGNAVAAAQTYKAFLDLEPEQAEAWAEYAGELVTLGQFGTAERACQTSLRIDPDQADARLLFIDCLLRQGNLIRAREVLDNANLSSVTHSWSHGLQAQFAELWAIYSLGMFEAQEFEEALRATDISRHYNPRNFHANANAGSIRMAQGFLQEAEVAFRQLAEFSPSVERARLLLITCLGRQGKLGDAKQEIEKVLRLKPFNPEVHENILAIYFNFGCWPEYRQEIERFSAVNPTAAQLDWEQSHIDLLFGDMPKGWQRYEARFNLPVESMPQRPLAEPAWNGEPFGGKTLLLWAEQGFGDTLMFLRYLPRVKALGGTVILETQPAMLDVAATCEGADLVIPAGKLLPPFDLQRSLMSLPWVFRTTLDTIPSDVPYVDVPEQVPNRGNLLECLSAAEGGLRIGLVWAGRPEHGRDFERSIPAKRLEPLADLPGIAWFSLQLGKREAPNLPGLVSLSPFLKSFSDTAYALSGMDLVITVDTALAHLAGALGIPTFLLLPFQPDFRWLLERDDSPWYPTMRLYRQPSYGNWEAVIQQVLTDLSMPT